MSEQQVRMISPYSDSWGAFTRGHLPDQLDRFTWMVDGVGSGLLGNKGFRRQVAVMLQGRLLFESVWSAVGYAWMAAPSSAPGTLALLAGEDGVAWPEAKVATVDPAALVADLRYGVPPLLTTFGHEGRVVSAVLAVCADSLRASITEATPAGFVKPAAGIVHLRADYQADRVGAGGSFIDALGASYDPVTPAGIYVVNTKTSREMAALMSDADHRLRGWLQITSMTDATGVGFSRDNSRVASMYDRRVGRQRVGATQLGALQARAGGVTRGVEA